MKTKLTASAIGKIKPPTRGGRIEVCDTEVPGLRLRITQSAQTYFVLYRNKEGQRQRYQICDTTVTPSEARKKAKGVLADVARGKDPAADKRVGKVSTLEQYLDNVLEPWMVGNRKGGKAMVNQIRSTFKPLLGRELSKVSAWAIEKHLAEARKEKGAAYGDRGLACLKAAFNRAVEWGVLPSNPLAKVKRVRLDSKKPLRILTVEEETKLMEALDKRDRRKRWARASHNLWCRERNLQEWPTFDGMTFVDYAKPMIVLALHCGLRRGELFSLGWSDIDLKRATLIVRGVVAKSGKTRVLPLNAAALEALKAWREQSRDTDLVFPSKETGERLDNVKKLWAGLRKETGIDARWHDMRHTFASRLLTAGASIEIVRELMGHSDIATTAIYLHATEDEKREAVARLASNGA